MSDQAPSIRRRVFTNLFGHASVVLPFVIGASSFAYPMATGGGGPWMRLVGAVGLLAAAGSVATRWLFKLDDLTQEAWDDVEQKRTDESEERLDSLERRLEVDGDPRTELLLRRLRRAESDLSTRGLAGNVNRASRVEISFQASDLVKQCVEALEASLALRARSREMFGPNRESMEALRHKEVAEVQACVETLERLALGGIGGTSETTTRLQSMRDELDQSLDVARRVEERMKSMESGIPSEPERGSYVDPTQ